MSRFDILDEDIDNDSKSINEPITKKTIEKINTLSIDDEIDNKYYTPMKKKNNKKINNMNNMNNTNNVNNIKNVEYQKMNIPKKNEHVKQDGIKNVFMIKEITSDEELLNEKIAFIFKIYFFHINNENWNDINNFQKVYNIEKWIDIGLFFNSLTKYHNKILNYNLFLMKNNISPLWESKENRNAGRINIQIYDLIESIQIFKILLIHISNKTLLIPSNYSKTDINGIAFLPKNDVKTNTPYQIIQIWFSNNIIQNISNKMELILNNVVFKMVDKYSTRLKIHKPQY